jgi:hypothetical protein
LAFELNYNQSNLSQNLDKLSVKLGAMILMYASTKAIKLQSEMQKNRPWTDRTGMAKATLRAVVSQPNENMIRITLSHGVSYGIWLELAHQKQFAIIGPTVQKESPKIVTELQGIMNQIKL